MLLLHDYHVIDARTVQEGVAFLLDQWPPRLHLVIEAAPIARCSSPGCERRSELFETRAADLRFTADEAAAYLNEMMGLPSEDPGKQHDNGSPIRHTPDVRTPRGRRKPNAGRRTSVDTAE